MRFAADFEGPDLKFQAKMLTMSVLIVGTTGYFLEYSTRSATDVLITTISGALFGQIVANIFGAMDQLDGNFRFSCLVASFTPLPSLTCGIAAIGLRHLFF